MVPVPAGKTRTGAPGKVAQPAIITPMGERYLKSVRLLAECLQGFERFSRRRCASCGLTHAQFDIIATLGNTAGMSTRNWARRP